MSEMDYDMPQPATVVGVFEDREQLQQAVEALHRAGFTDSQIGVALHGGDAGITFEPDETASGEGAATGAITGGLIGGLLGAVAVGLIPGIGPVLAAGALAGVLGGAAIGATAGGILGALAGMGIPEEEARYYNQEFEAGRHLVTIRAADRYDEAREILADYGAYDVHSQGDRKVHTSDIDSSGGGHSPYTPERTVETTIPGTTEVRVSDEDRGAGMTSAGPTAGGTFVEHTETGEPVVYDAPPKDRVYDTTTYNVGSTDTGAVVTGTTSGGAPYGWEDESPRYRDRWQRRYGSTGGRFEDYEPGYRYGFEMRSRPEYRGRSWGEVEPEFRRDWEMKHHDKPWDRFSEAIRDAWEGATGRDEDRYRAA